MADAMPSPPTSPRSSTPLTQQPPSTSTSDPPPFDIVSTYKHLLSTDPDLTMPIAAIESLIHLLSTHPSTTISETLDLLARSTTHLKNSIPNPISLSAGTDLFQRYLITTLTRPTSSTSPPDFPSLRAHLLSNSLLFVSRAKQSRAALAAIASHFLRPSTTLLTLGSSRAVHAVISHAAHSTLPSPVRFRVIYVSSPESAPTIASLRALGVPVAAIPESAVAYCMSQVDMVLVGAEGVVENGGVVSRMGTYQVGVLAKAAGKPFYVVAESHKFVRMYPLGEGDLGVEQGVVEFRTGEEGRQDEAAGKRGDGEGEARWDGRTPAVVEEKGRREYFEGGEKGGGGGTSGETKNDLVDYTPPELITALITESGVHTPSAVSEELIKIWY